ncbi:hypothetical protein [Agromyces sp. LHK192]|uniref:hypothetical protein n=1 Tax=Agromyces sp. LHK192 TaxID=2498704 RepID=UPI000FD70BA0|nr:hypothetical protein [Agromyces sp. LHK192]
MDIIIKKILAAGAIAAVIVLAIPTTAQAAMQWYKNSQSAQAQISSSSQISPAAGGRARTFSTGGVMKTYVDHYRAGSRIGGGTGAAGDVVDFVHPSQNLVTAYCYWNSNAQISGTTLQTCGVKNYEGDTGLPPIPSRVGSSEDFASSSASQAASDIGVGTQLATAGEASYRDWVAKDGGHCVSVSEGDLTAQACTEATNFLQRGVAVGLRLASGEVKAAYVLPEAVGVGGAEGVLATTNNRLVVDAGSGAERGAAATVNIIGASGKTFAFPDLTTGWIDIPGTK